MQRLARGAAAISLSVVIGIDGQVISDASGTSVSDDRVAAAAAERATFGLPASAELVRELIESGADVGTAEWGIVLTQAENESLDLVGRMEFVDLMRPAIELAQSHVTSEGHT